MDDTQHPETLASDDATSAWGSASTGADEPSAVEETALDVMVLEDAPALELPVWEPTGDGDVDAALEQLRRLDDAELAEHVAVFTEVHAALHARLSGISGQPGA